MGSIWRQSVDAAEQSALTLVNLPRFKSDLLKSNEEIAPQSREILQTFVWWGVGGGGGEGGAHQLARNHNLTETEIKTNQFQSWQLY